MNRRDTKESIRKVFHDLRARIPGLVLRASIIAGLPGEGEKEFEELCDFLREEKIERAGVFPFSPEEGTKAATMEHVPMEEAQRRTELLVDVQSDIIDEYNESVLGDVREVLCEGWSEEAQSFVGRSYAESVDIDGKIYFSAERDIMAGEFVNVRLTGTMDGELTGEAVEKVNALQGRRKERYDNCKQADDHAHCADPRILSGAVPGLRGCEMVGARYFHCRVPDGLCRRLHRPPL